MSEFHDVGQFHFKFGLDNVTYNGPGPRQVSEELLDFRERFMEEELREFKEARAAGNIVDMADALVDQVYVIIGTAHLLGLPWFALWSAVQNANMAKQRAVTAEESARGSTFDVIKPPGWQPPNIEMVLERAGWTFPCAGPGLCPGLRVTGSRFCAVHIKQKP